MTDDRAKDAQDAVPTGIELTPRHSRGRYR